jgi:transcriptional regulator with XRE-family HTH domain
MSKDRAALGAFLRFCRDRLTPAQAGIQPFPGPRRVPGLRREELAVAAGVSADYYSRVEQGRQPTVSAEVLDALARVLRLDEVERSHLIDWAAPLGRRLGGQADGRQRPDPGLLRVMTALEHVPVLLLGPRAEVLARNALLRAVLGRSFEPGTSFMRYLFRDPLAREWIINWPEFAAAAVAAMRLAVGRQPADQRLLAEVDDLRRTDPDVARWWEDHAVRDDTSVTKYINHPHAGTLAFGIEIVTAPHALDQRLIVYTTPPASPTAQLLPILASWVADTPADYGAAQPRPDNATRRSRPAIADSAHDERSGGVPSPVTGGLPKPPSSA